MVSLHFRFPLSAIRFSLSLPSSIPNPASRMHFLYTEQTEVTENANPSVLSVASCSKNDSPLFRSSFPLSACSLVAAATSPLFSRRHLHLRHHLPCSFQSRIPNPQSRMHFVSAFDLPLFALRPPLLPTSRHCHLLLRVVASVSRISVPSGNLLRKSNWSSGNC